MLIMKTICPPSCYHNEPVAKKPGYLMYDCLSCHRVVT